MEVSAGKHESGLAIALEGLGEVDGGGGGLANGGGNSGGGRHGEAEGVIGIGGRVVVVRDGETDGIGENSVGFGVGRAEAERRVWRSVSHTCARCTHKHFPLIEYFATPKSESTTVLLQLLLLLNWILHASGKEFIASFLVNSLFFFLRIFIISIYLLFQF